MQVVDTLFRNEKIAKNYPSVFPQASFEDRAGVLLHRIPSGT